MTARPRPAALALLLAACATARPPPREIVIREPAVIEAHPADVDLEAKNDEELFAIGSAAYQAGQHARAAAAFARLADAFPDSRHAAAALYDAGLAYRRLERWGAALERFRRLAEGWRGPDADEAAFLAAECLFRLGRRGEARAALDALAARDDLSPEQRVRAVTERGVVELEDGALDEAERSLQAALAARPAAEREARLEGHDAAKARFYLGEVERRRFQAVQLDAGQADEALLARRLEEKSQRLLAAQGHYLLAMRAGDPDFAVAAGARVGELYDALHTELTGAPLPAGLDEEGARAYRAELRLRVRVLLTKAIVAYEETLAAARRAGVDNEFVPRAEAALARMKKLLDDDDARASSVSG